MAAADDVQVGDLVNVPGGMHGTVRFLGTVAGKPGRFAGVELSPELAGRGKNSGDVDGRQYFTTSIPGSGIFVPINNSKYVTRRAVAPQTTPARAAPSITNFSRSVGPGLSLASTARPRIRRPSLPRPDSPSKASLPSPKLNVSGLRTPSGVGRPRTPLRSRPPSRPSSRISMDSTTPRRRDAVRTPAPEDPEAALDRTKELETQLRERDKQLEDQAATLAEFQQCVTELEGLDALQVRAQLREKNEKISALTAEFDSHRADFRSTLDTLEVAAAETERVYEKKIEELLQENRDLQSRGGDVEAVAMQLKQLEELVSELEEGLEDARRGEAEARGDVEYLRGEVERTRLELKQERERSSAAAPKDGETSAGDRHYYPTARDLEQKDDEIRGLKAIIHSLSRGDPTSQAFLQQNGIQPGKRMSDGDYDTGEQPSHTDLRIRELEAALEQKTQMINELRQEVESGQTNAFRGHNRSGTITTSPLRVHKNPQQPGGGRTSPNAPTHSHTLSDRTVVPNDWSDSSPVQRNSGQYARNMHSNSDAHHRLAAVQEPDGQSSSTDDGSAAWCEICETSGHDILTCTNMFGTASANASKPPAATSHPAILQAAQQPPPVTGPPERSNIIRTSIDSTLHDSIESTFSAYKSSSALEANGFAKTGSPSSQRTGRDAVIEGLKGIGGLPSSSMSPIAGKASGVIDESKWCALCERDGHESIDCPFDE